MKGCFTKYTAYEIILLLYLFSVCHICRAKIGRMYEYSDLEWTYTYFETSTSVLYKRHGIFLFLFSNFP
jgi:hypothetical protein